VHKLPWFLSRATHLALMAAKDEQIAALRDELSVSRSDRVAAEQARDAAITRALDILTPQPAIVAAAPAPRTERTVPPTLDLAEVDPADTAAVRDLALNEMPAGKVSARLLLHKMDNIRAQIHAARAAKSARAMEVGTIATAAPEPPAWVGSAIEEAIAKGREQARAN